MGSHNLQVPCSALFLLLILQLLPRGRADGLKYKGPGWKILHRLGLGRSSNTSLQSNVHSCRGIFDLYFILDKSGSVDNNWFEIYSFVENLVKKFQNSRVRISFIVYSTDANVLMPLTSDRQEIRQGLNKLQQVVPVGHTYMQEGFKKAIHQIENAKSLGNVSSVIIALTDGTLLPDAFEATKEEAHKARKLGSIIYTVGVLEYNRDQLLAIADTPEHMFGVQNGFKGLQSIVDSLSARACVEARSVELTTLCAGEPYEVIVSGHGFQNAKHPSLIVCRFKFNNNILDEKAISMTEKTIVCPGPVLDKAGQTVIVQISLNNGITFLGNQISYSNIRCGNDDSNLKLLAFLPALLLLPLLLWCCWKLCCKKRVKKPPPPPPPEAAKEEIEDECPTPPAAPCQSVNAYPTLVISCCGCASRPMQGTVAPCCYIPSACHQTFPCCSPRIQGRGTSFAVMNPSCTQVPCPTRICLRPSQECCTIPQATCAPRICLQSNRDCVSIPKAVCSARNCCQLSRECFPVAQTVCPPRVCAQPRQCPPLRNYQAKYTRTPSKMLPLLSPQARKSGEFPYCPYPYRSTSDGSKT
ncbi:anthrax toxin receptor-like [Dipodomys merriami]|uniref:anthrax toxin receptor-like n=1 Tax=Dipodomys merriami TaxID=94247 RepID=UPI0038558854